MRQLVIVHFVGIFAVDADAAAGGAVNGREHIQKRALAAAGRPHDGNELTGFHAEIDIAQSRIGNLSLIYFSKMFCC